MVDKWRLAFMVLLCVGLFREIDWSFYHRGDRSQLTMASVRYVFQRAYNSVVDTINPPPPVWLPKRPPPINSYETAMDQYFDGRLFAKELEKLQQQSAEELEKQEVELFNRLVMSALDQHENNE